MAAVTRLAAVLAVLELVGEFWSNAEINDDKERPRRLRRLAPQPWGYPNKDDSFIPNYKGHPQYLTGTHFSEPSALQFKSQGTQALHDPAFYEQPLVNWDELHPAAARLLEDEPHKIHKKPSPEKRNVTKYQRGNSYSHVQRRHPRGKPAVKPHHNPSLSTGTELALQNQTQHGRGKQLHQEQGSHNNTHVADGMYSRQQYQISNAQHEDQQSSNNTQGSINLYTVNNDWSVDKPAPEEIRSDDYRPQHSNKVAYNQPQHLKDYDYYGDYYDPRDGPLKASMISTLRPIEVEYVVNQTGGDRSHSTPPESHSVAYEHLDSDVEDNKPDLQSFSQTQYSRPGDDKHVQEESPNEHLYDDLKSETRYEEKEINIPHPSDYSSNGNPDSSQENHENYEDEHHDYDDYDEEEERYSTHPPHNFHSTQNEHHTHQEYFRSKHAGDNHDHKLRPWKHYSYTDLNNDKHIAKLQHHPHPTRHYSGKDIDNDMRQEKPYQLPHTSSIYPWKHYSNDYPDSLVEVEKTLQPAYSLSHYDSRRPHAQEYSDSRQGEPKRGRGYPDLSHSHHHQPQQHSLSDWNNDGGKQANAQRPSMFALAGGRRSKPVHLVQVPTPEMEDTDERILAERRFLHSGVNERADNSIRGMHNNNHQRYLRIHDDDNTRRQSPASPISERFLDVDDGLTTSPTELRVGDSRRAIREGGTRRGFPAGGAKRALLSPVSSRVLRLDESRRGLRGDDNSKRVLSSVVYREENRRASSPIAERALPDAPALHVTNSNPPSDRFLHQSLGLSSIGNGYLHETKNDQQLSPYSSNRLLQDVSSDSHLKNGFLRSNRNIGPGKSGFLHRSLDPINSEVLHSDGHPIPVNREFLHNARRLNSINNRDPVSGIPLLQLGLSDRLLTPVTTQAGRRYPSTSIELEGTRRFSNTDDGDWTSSRERDQYTTDYSRGHLRPRNEKRFLYENANERLRSPIVEERHSYEEPLHFNKYDNFNSHSGQPYIHLEEHDYNSKINSEKFREPGKEYVWQIAEPGRRSLTPNDWITQPLFRRNMNPEVENKLIESLVRRNLEKEGNLYTQNLIRRNYFTSQPPLIRNAPEETSVEARSLDPDRKPGFLQSAIGERAFDPEVGTRYLHSVVSERLMDSSPEKTLNNTSESDKAASRSKRSLDPFVRYIRIADLDYTQPSLNRQRRSGPVASAGFMEVPSSQPMLWRQPPTSLSSSVGNPYIYKTSGSSLPGMGEREKAQVIYGSSGQIGLYQQPVGHEPTNQYLLQTSTAPKPQW